MSEQILPLLQTSANGQGQPDIKKPAVPDPFDLGRLRLSQDFVAAAGVKRIINTIPVSKPAKSWFVRVHPSEEYRIQASIIELKEDRELYWVDPALWPGLATEATFGPRVLFTAITRQNVLFLWPVRLPGPDGKSNTWNQSALEAATMAEKKWCRVVANMHLGAYEVLEAAGELAAPTWPELSLEELIRIAFKDRLITSHDHPVLRKLRGET